MFVRCAAACLLVVSLPAQNPTSGAVQKLLAPDAVIIETASLNLGPGKTLALVLWMAHPERVVRHRGDEFCGYDVHGDYWIGPTRLSLFDLAKPALVNTVEIRSPYDNEHVFQIPFLVSNLYYYVSRPNAVGEGQPTVLNLRDLTGEGVAGQFVLFEYGACGIASTSVFGYSPRSQRAVQYRVEVNGRRKTEAWVEQIFGVDPILPGFWDFTWEPGHGADVMIHEQVSFDKVRQSFVDKQKITSYPAAVRSK